MYLIVDIRRCKIVEEAVSELEAAEGAAELLLNTVFKESVEPGQLVLH